jgi:uncharacterized phage-associated protein
MKNIIKIKAFEYVVSRLIEWYLSRNSDQDYKSDFTKLKLIKLLFFVTSAKATRSNEGLLTIFDNIWAMPYGHVESDIYDNLNQTVAYKISRNGLIENQIDFNSYFSGIDTEKVFIDQSIQKLKEENPDLINYNSFELVELSHRWESWQTVFSLAKSQGKLSLKIPNITIQNEPKLFSLTTHA